jgi:hypothetical protein
MKCYKTRYVKLVNKTFTEFYGKNECYIKKGKAIPVTGREDPEGCETSML